MIGKPEGSAPFVGAWSLISYELSLPSGVVEKPMGDRPLGRILYLDNGQMSAQVAASGLEPLANADPRRLRQKKPAVPGATTLDTGVPSRWTPKLE